MTRLLLVAGLIAGMEVARCGWHGRFRRHVGLYSLHAAAILGLWVAVGANMMLPCYVFSIMAAFTSYITLSWRDDDPAPLLWQARVTLALFTRRWPGWDGWHVLSLLSALPIQAATVLTVCWPLPGWQRWAALAAFAVEGVVIKKGLWTWGRLVPQHWR